MDTIVTWDWTEEAKIEADSNKILLWDFRQILKEIATEHSKNKRYFTDDTARTIQLCEKAGLIKEIL